MANPYQRPGWKDPRPSAQESASALSSYFQDQATKRPQVISPYSAPAEPAGSSAGGPSASSAPKSAAGGGTGFVSFGQYFGANAPAIQQQAQQATTDKTRTELGTLQQPGGYAGGSAFDQMLAGGVVQREAAAQQKRQESADLSRIQAEQAAPQRARAQAVHARQQYMEEEPPESRKSRSRPVGSRFGDYFND